MLKALRKNPAERYSSAGALAENITRYLTGLPLAARDDGWLDRIAKFITRHRAGVIAAALIVVSLVGGLAAAVSQAREAERQRQLAQQHFDEVRRLALGEDGSPRPWRSESRQPRSNANGRWRKGGFIEN